MLEKKKTSPHQLSKTHPAIKNLHLQICFPYTLVTITIREQKSSSSASTLQFHAASKFHSNCHALTAQNILENIYKWEGLIGRDLRVKAAVLIRCTQLQCCIICFGSLWCNNFSLLQNSGNVAPAQVLCHSMQTKEWEVGSAKTVM